MSHRWTYFDTDAYRLPTGFTRTSYDSDTRRYYFADAEGRMYQGEPGEEFGGRLTPMDAIDPPSSTRHLFATDDDEVGGDVIQRPLNSSEVGGPRPAFTPPEQRTRHASSFSDFLSSSQMETASPSKPTRKNSLDRGFTSSVKRATTSITESCSTKLKGRASTLPNLPPTGANERGVMQSRRSARF